MAKLELGMNHFLFCPLKRGKGGYSPANSILSYTTFRESVRKCVERVGLDPKEYGTHSGCSGGASNLAPHVTEHELLVSGRWRDPRSLRSYVELTDKTRLDTNKVLLSTIVKK